MVVLLLLVEQIDDDKIGHMDQYALVVVAVVEVIVVVIMVVLVVFDNYDLIMNVIVDTFVMMLFLMNDLMMTKK